MKRLISKSMAIVAVAALPFAAQTQAWEPTKNVEFIIPAGTGGRIVGQ